MEGGKIASRAVEARGEAVSSEEQLHLGSAFGPFWSFFRKKKSSKKQSGKKGGNAPFRVCEDAH